MLQIFKKRHGEMLLTKDIYATRLESGNISDVGFSESGLKDGKWLTDKIAFAAGGRLRKRNLEVADWASIGSVLLLTKCLVTWHAYESSIKQMQLK